MHIVNLDDCLAYLQSQFNVDVEVHAEASASVSCAAAPLGSAPFDVGAIAAMAVGAGFLVSRRRRRS